MPSPINARSGSAPLILASLDLLVAVDKELDYEKLKKSLAFFVERYLPPEFLTPETHPVRLLEQMEMRRMAMARRGLAVAIADNLEGTQDLSASEVREADEEMEKIGGYTITFLRSRFTRRRNKI